MENREIFSAITALPPLFVRLDGRSFHHLADTLSLQKPFDERFSRAMVQTCSALVSSSGLGPVCAYTFSDEINLWFTRLPFNGRVEKIDSVAASFAASAFTLALESPAVLAFDGRVIPATAEFALEYLAARQNEAWRNHLNGYCQQALIAEGMGPREAAEHLRGLPSRDLHDMMHARGVNLATTPAWQRRGVMVCKGTVTKEGYNPMTGEHVAVERSAIVVENDLPVFTTPEGRAFLRNLLSI